MSKDLRDEVLRLLREDEVFRLAVIGLLGISDVQSSLRRLVDAVGGLVKNQSVMMEVLNKVLEAVQRLTENEEKLWENQNKLWEENNKIWQEIKSLREDQERLWQEIRALRESQEKAWREIERLWQELKTFREEQEKRWQENEKRWEMNFKMWEQNWKLWQENLSRWEEQFKFNNWMMSALREIRDSIGGSYEYYTAHWIREWLSTKGVSCDVKVNVTIPVDGFKEIDVVCYDPLVVGEATIKVSSVEEAERELKKLLDNAKTAEKFFGKKAIALVLAVESAPEQVAEYLRKRAGELSIVLVLGREYS
ncbi:hypothetical protein [Vulcanisaeta moutnovskia]|nr:hypothetical protein [Vulcanisaeta moutnovskia]